MREHVGQLPTRRPVRGAATVELFTERGRLLHRERAENFVSQRMLDAAAWWANWSWFALRPNQTSSTSTSSLYSGPFSDVPNHAIALTDYDGQPDPANEHQIRGVPLGHAQRGLGQTGSYRGGYNSLESIHNFTFDRYVFDFPTSVANGVFQSVYSGPFLSPSDRPFTYTPTRALSLNPGYWNSTGVLLRDWEQERTYWVRNGGISGVDDDTLWSVVWGDDPTVEGYDSEFGTADKPESHRSVVLRSGRAYWLTERIGSGASTVRKIVSAPISDLESTTVERTLDIPWAMSHGATGNSGLAYLAGFAYDWSRDKWFLGSGSAQTSSAPAFAVMSLDEIGR